MQAQVTPQRPPRPVADVKTVDWTANWWQETDNQPHIDLGIKAHECCQQILHPAWYDEKDPFKGRALDQQKSRRDKREVRTPLVFLNNQQNTAQAVPDTHDVKWKPDEFARPERLGTDPSTDHFAKSIRSVVKKYLREIYIQDTLEACVQDAHNFPAAVLKVHFERELEREPLKGGVEQDGQDNLARIQQLSEDIARGIIPKDDRRVVELQDLLAGIGEKGEIDVREGLVVQNLDMRQIRFPKLPNLESIYSSPWISHEDPKAKRKLRALFPYKVTKADENGNPIEWEGIHPEDLEAATPCAGKRADTLRQSRDLPTNQRFTSNNPNGNRTAADENVELLTREVWDRESGYVYVFVEGVPYPAAKWKPTRTPEQWYPFIFLVLNRVFGQVLGIADSELQGDTQARIHMKETDLENARLKGQPTGIINSSMMDQKVSNKVIEWQPYTWTPMALGANKDALDSMIKTFEFRVEPLMFDTGGDYVALQKTASLPQQALGGTGGPNAPEFAKEVEVAAAGAQISNSFRGSRIRRFLERFYDLVAQILLQELDQDAALAVDPTALWPQFYGDQEADAAYKQVQAEVRAEVVHTVIREVAPIDPMTGMPNLGAIDPMAVKRRTAEISQPIIEERCVQRFGLPRPLSRKSLYSQLCVHVVVVPDGELDRRNRLRAFMGGLEATAAIMEASERVGVVPNLDPILRVVAHLGGGDEDMAQEMFDVDPNHAAMQLIQGVQKGGTLTPETIAALGQLAAQYAMANPNPNPQAGATPAPAGKPAPAPMPAPSPAPAPAGAPAP